MRKRALGHPLLTQRCGELTLGLALLVVRQREAAVVHCHRRDRPQVQVRLHRLGRVHVHGRHEPARLERADGQQRHARAPQPLADVAEVRAVARVPRVVDAARRGVHVQPAPQTPVEVERRAPREVLGWREHHHDAGRHLHRLPPVQLVHVADAVAREHLAHAQPGHDLRRRVRLQALQRAHAEVIVVVVAEQHHVDGRQVLEADAGSAEPLGPHEPEWAAARLPDGVRQHVEPVVLDERGGVPHPRDAHLAPVHALCRCGPGSLRMGVTLGRLRVKNHLRASEALLWRRPFTSVFRKRRPSK
jgi:hypothetical protein